MEPVFGNHLGMVISNNDPEGRKRVQVFIPYLTNTLFADWNNKLKDVTFRTTVDLQKYGVLDRLKQTLPWAEYAAPIFGGATSVTSNSSTGKVEVNNTGTPTFAGFDAMGGVSMVNPNSTALLTSNNQGNLPPAPASPPTSQPSSLASANNNVYFRSNVDNVTLNIDTDGIGSPSSFEDSNRQTQTSVQGLNANTQSFFVLPDKPEYYKYKGKAIYAKNNTTGKSIMGIVGDFGPPTEGFGEMSLYAANELGVWQEGLGNAANTGQDVEFLVLGDSQTFGSNFNPEDLKKIADSNNLQSTQLASLGNANQQSTFSSIDSQNDPKNGEAAQTNTWNSASGSPNGTVSVPNESAKVWVFFYGGDIQRPVYFASAIEGST